MLPSFSSCKNIILDLGGVLLNIDYSLLISSFGKLGVSHFEEHFSKVSQEELFDRYEKGSISSDVFRERLLKECKPGTLASDIDDAWNAMLLDLPEKRYGMLQKLKKSHRTFLLSNTNDIHMKHINAYLKRSYGIPDLSGCFEKMYLSYEVGMRKPDAEIFELVLRENALLPSETLFIDDSPQHLKAAAKLGIQTYWLDVKRDEVVDLLCR